MNTNRYALPVVIVLTFLTALAIFLSYRTNPANASAFPGQQTSIATTSNPAVTNTASLVFASSTCTARIITTAASPIMITFGDIAGNGGPTGTFGHLQAASTTVVYDSGQVGCGALRVYSFTSQNITVSEAR